jgi:uncharacterized protein
MKLSRYCKKYPCAKERGAVTLFSTKSMSAINVPEEFVQDVEKGALSDDERETLQSLEFLAPGVEEEKQEMLGFIDELNGLSTTFTALVVLNLDCNLGCTYCFEGTRKGKHYLSERVADQFVDFLQTGALEGKEAVNIIFYGGEPLLSVDMIVRISERIRSPLEQKKIRYAFSLITNGTLLTPRVVKKLKPLGLKAASVTLDGPREVHDAFRPFKTGKGSFDTIVRNIQDVCSSIDVQIGGNFTQERYREFPRLLDVLPEKGLTPEKISFVKFDPVMNESNEFAPPDFHDGCMTMDEPWLFEASIFLREEILKRGFRTQKLTPSVCMVELRNNLVVNYDGALYKCPGLIGRKGFRVGTVAGGVIDYRLSHCLGNWKNEECLSCGYLPLCFGGCRYMKLVQEGHMRGVNCRKKYFDNALGELVSQDIRYNL